jgi:Family of unknown function (DUF6090)
MAKLFNNIRKKLLTEKPSISRTSNYLKYAIGEIILVMIGILLALQVSNWNEERKHKKHEKIILTNLLDDLIKAEVTSLNQIDEEKTKIDYLVKMLSKEGQKFMLDNIKKDSIFSLIFWELYTDTPVINSYSDLKNAGNLALITNDSIRQAFTSLEKNIVGLNSTLKDRLTVQQINFDKIVINKLNFLMMYKSHLSNYKIDFGKETDFASLLKQQNILNIIAIKLSFTESSLKARTSLLNDIQSLIKSIQKILEKN